MEKMKITSIGVIFGIMEPLRISETAQASNSKFGMHRWIPRGTNGKMKNSINGGHQGVTDRILVLWDPLRISGTVEARNSKLGMQVDPRGTTKKNEKLGQRNPIFEFWEPLHISITVEARNLKLDL